MVEVGAGRPEIVKEVVGEMSVFWRDHQCHLYVLEGLEECRGDKTR